MKHASPIRFATSLVATCALVFAGLIATPSAANAAGDVSVTVLDSVSLAPIDGAFVSLIATAPSDSDGDGLLDVDTGSAVVGGRADASGIFAPTKTDLSALDDARYGVVATAAGYQSLASSLTVASSAGTVTVKLVSSGQALTALSAFGGSFTGVAADGRKGVFYATSTSIPSVFRSTDYAGSWSPTNLLRDEGVDVGSTDGIQGLASGSLASHLVTSGYPGEVAVTVGNTEWYSRDFGNNWHSFELPAANPTYVGWAHAHAADTTDHASLMVFSYASNADLAYAFMPTGNEGTAIGASGKVEKTITPTVLSGAGSLRDSSTDLVAVAAGASSVFIAVQQGLAGTRIFEVTPADTSIVRSAMQPILVPELTRSTANGNANPDTRDVLLFGGQSNVDGVPSSLTVYDRTSVGSSTTATVAMASLSANADGIDVWSTSSSIWTDQAGGGFQPATGAIGDKTSGKVAPSCSEQAGPVRGSLAPMFAGVGNFDAWQDGATVAAIRSCVFIHVLAESTIDGTVIPAGAVLALDVSGVSGSASGVFDAGFDFGQSDEVMLATNGFGGLTKSATWLTGGADGSVRNVDNVYGYRPLFAAAADTADNYVQNQAAAGTDISSGGFSAKGLTAARINDLSFDPVDPSAQLVSLAKDGGNRTLMSVDSGASFFTVGPASDANTWWVDGTGQHWIAGGESGSASSMLAVRQFSQDDLANTQIDVVEGGLDPDDPNYLGIRLGLSEPFADFGASQFKTSGQQTAKVQALQGVANTSSMLMAAGNDSSSSLALVTLAGEPGAETIGSSKFMNSAGSWVGSISTPSFSGVSVSAIRYCPAGSANSVADKAFIALADQVGNASGGVRVLSNVAGGSPTMSSPAASGLTLSPNDNIRDLQVDCDSGVIALVSRAATGAASPSSPVIFASNNAGASFKPVTKNAGQAVGSTLNDLEGVTVKSDSAFATFDIVATSIAGDVITGNAKLSDFSKDSISMALKSVNDPFSQIATTINGELPGDLEFSPSNTSVGNYITLTGSQVSHTPTAQTAQLATASGLFKLNLALAKLIPSKPSDTVTATVKIGAGDVATWTGAVTLTQDKTALISATAASSLPVTITTSSPCVFSAGTLSSNASSGQCKVTFVTAGNNSYAPANETRTVTLAPAPPKLDDAILVTYKTGGESPTTWIFNEPSLPNGVSTTVTASSASGLAVTVALSSGNCSFTNGVLTAAAPSGTCQLAFSTLGNKDYYAANVTRVMNLVHRVDTLGVSVAVGAAPAADGAQAAAWTNTPITLRYGDVAKFNAGAASKAQVQSSVAGSCTLNNGILAATAGSGSCTVTFTTTGAQGWDAISETRVANLALGLDGIQVVIADSQGERAWDAGDIEIAYGAKATIKTSTKSGNAVKIAATGSCSLANGLLTATAGAGKCELKFTTTASAKFAASTVTRTFNLKKAQDVISLSKAPKDQSSSDWPAGQAAVLAFGSSISVAANSSSALPLTYEVTGPCSLDSGVLSSTTGTGSCTIRVSTAGTANVSGALEVREVSLARAADSISATLAIDGSAPFDWTQATTDLRSDKSAEISAQSSSQRDVTITAEGSCVFADATLHSTANTGTCKVTASVAQDDKYEAISRTWTLKITAKPVIQDTLAVSFRQLFASEENWTPWTPLASTGAVARYGSQIQLSSRTLSGTEATFAATGSCSLKAKTLTITAGAGTCTVKATVASTDGFKGTSTSRVFKLSLASVAQVKLTSMKVGGKQALETVQKIGAKQVKLTYALAPASTGICQIVGGSVVAKKRGVCTLTVTAAAVPGLVQAYRESVSIKVS